MIITVKEGVSLASIGDTSSRQYGFMGIERSEFHALHEFIKSKNIEILGVEVSELLLRTIRAVDVEDDDDDVDDAAANDDDGSDALSRMMNS